jgi:hypothetical protein
MCRLVVRRIVELVGTVEFLFIEICRCTQHVDTLTWFDRVARDIGGPAGSSREALDGT